MTASERQRAKPIAVLIPDGEQDTAFKVLTSLALIPKIRIHVISSGERPRTRYSRFSASYCARRGTSEQEWFDQIREVVQRWQIDVILPVHAEAIGFSCRWREKLSALAALPFLPETSAFELTLDKATLADFLDKHDLPGPRTIPVAHAPGDIGFPLLLKPRRSSGGRGIRLCEDSSALREFVSTHAASLDDYIAQELVEGRDFSANVFCRDGKVLAHTLHQRTRPSPRPFAPSFCVRLVCLPQLLHVVERLMSALNWSGIANVGTRYNERTGRSDILDFNPRFNGNLMCSTAAGVNFPYLSCLSALKLPLPESRYRLQEYMEIKHALERIAPRFKRHGQAIPNLFRETNLRYILRDPEPFLRRCER